MKNGSFSELCLLAGLLWSVFPDTGDYVDVFGHAAARYHDEVHVPCGHVDACSLSMIQAAKGNHVEFLDPCCHWLLWVRKLLLQYS